MFVYVCWRESRQQGFLERVSTQLQEAFKQAEAGKHLGRISHEDSFSKWLPGLEDL